MKMRYGMLTAVVGANADPAFVRKVRMVVRPDGLQRGRGIHCHLAEWNQSSAVQY